MQFTGKIKAILPQVTGTSSKGEWVKQTIVIGVQNGNYEDMLAMDAWNDQAAIVSGLSLETEITADVNIKSREFNGKWYSDIQAWKITVNGGVKAPQGYATQAPTQQPQVTSNQQVDDGLPF